MEGICKQNFSIFEEINKKKCNIFFVLSNKMLEYWNDQKIKRKD